MYKRNFITITYSTCAITSTVFRGIESHRRMIDSTGDACREVLIFK